MITLITAAEAVRYAPVKSDFPTSMLCQQIPAEELNAFIDHIGKDFYDRLKADLVDYNGTDLWSPSATYADGDLVVHEGIVYESLIANNEEPIGDPLNLNAWKEADKFTTQCFNLLWVDGFLREFLAFTMIASVLPHVTYQTGSIGTVQKYEDATGVKTVSDPGFGKIVNEIQRGKTIRLSLLAQYMIDHGSECDYSGALGSLCNVVYTNPPRVRRTFYKR